MLWRRSCGLAGVTCKVFERRGDEPNLTRAFAVHARTLELLDARGLADRLLTRGIKVRFVAPVPGASLDLGILPSRYPTLLIVPQSGTELLLEERVHELGGEILRGHEVMGLTQDADHVRLDVAGPGGRHTITARYVVGTDGAHSVVRDLVGVDFVGAQYATHIMLADVRLDRPPGETLFGATTPDGLVLFVPFGDGWFRAIAWDRTREQVPLDEPITLEELRCSFRRIAGDDFGMGEPRWRTRFLSERRQARNYRKGRVFLAGDAAHVHSPVGGQGMNTGIQDALNLGWKLAADVQGWARPGLLDSYEEERHPVGERVLRMTDGAYKLVMSRSQLGAAARRAAIRTMLHLPPARRRIAGLLSGIDIHYERPAHAHRWVGRRMPDLPGNDGGASTRPCAPESSSSSTAPAQAPAPDWGESFHWPPGGRRGCPRPCSCGQTGTSAGPATMRNRSRSGPRSASGADRSSAGADKGLDAQAPTLVLLNRVGRVRLELTTRTHETSRQHLLRLLSAATVTAYPSSVAPRTLVGHSSHHV